MEAAYKKIYIIKKTEPLFGVPFFVAMHQMNGVDKMKCRDIEMIVTLTDEGTIDQVEMNFNASIKYMGYDADAAYKLMYSFIL